MLSRIKPFLAGCSVAGLILASGMATAGNEEDTTATYDQEDQTVAAGTEAAGTQDQELSGPAEDVQESVEVLQQLKQQEPELAQRLADAKGVFIIPDYATASLLVGGSGGEGVLMENRDGEWGNPGFYDIGNIDVGAQAGAAAGSIVMLLMSDEAVRNFHSGTEFALTAQAGLTIINWSAQAAGSTEDGDVLLWTDTEGLLAEASVGVGGISWDEEEASEYYNQQDLTADQVLAGDVQNPHENVLQSEFAEFTTGQSQHETGHEQQDSEYQELDTDEPLQEQQ